MTSLRLGERLKMKKSLFIFENKLIPSDQVSMDLDGRKHVRHTSRETTEFILLYFREMLSENHGGRGQRGDIYLWFSTLTLELAELARS